MMPLWFKRACWWTGELACILLIFWHCLIWSVHLADWYFSGAVYKDWDARLELTLGIPEGACLTRDMVLAETAARDWGVEDVPSLGSCPTPSGVSNWLRVITPEGYLLPGNDENVTYFGFDAQGCSIFLPTGSGTNGICPVD